jgi:hypothetical protein
MNRYVLAVLIASFGFAGAAQADATVKATGCVAAGVEMGCLVLRTFGGTVYNITAAKPRPKVGTYGRVEGVPSILWSFCMQGAPLNPATWKQTGKFCPKMTGK